MSTTTINWRANCMTVGIHDGRSEREYRTSLSEIELSDEAIFLMVEHAITHDAQMFVDHGEPKIKQQWADRVEEIWQDNFHAVVADARKNAERYQAEIKKQLDRGNTKGAEHLQHMHRTESNSSWNDHVNYIVRRLGVGASQRAASEMGNNIQA